MGISTATVTPTNISLCPMQVVFNSVDLGGTVDSVTVNIKTTLADIMVDQWGKTPADKRVSGCEYTIKTTLAEIYNKDNWKVAFPSFHEVTAGTKAMYFDLEIGDGLLARAQTLTLHPLEKTSGDKTGDYTFYKAIAINASEVKYGPEKQTGLSIEWAVFPDTTTNPPRLFFFGDTSVSVTNASLAAASPGSNTGNGTISAEVASNQYTKTETITLTCVGTGAASANVWLVKGADNQILFEGTLASSNLSTLNVAPVGANARLTCTINQGTVQFVTGDSFTIAATAANYA